MDSHLADRPKKGELMTLMTLALIEASWVTRLAMRGKSGCSARISLLISMTMVGWAGSLILLTICLACSRRWALKSMVVKVCAPLRFSNDDMSGRRLTVLPRQGYHVSRRLRRKNYR